MKLKNSESFIKDGKGEIMFRDNQNGKFYLLFFTGVPEDSKLIELIFNYDYKIVTDDNGGSRKLINDYISRISEHEKKQIESTGEKITGGNLVVFPQVDDGCGKMYIEYIEESMQRTYNISL